MTYDYEKSVKLLLHGMNWAIIAGNHMIFKKIGIFIASVVLATVVYADTLEVNENHPTKYVVQKGDTLWDISAKFLKKPWYWPKIWNVNPQINDPHWIYPGDVLTLVWIDGKPYVQREKVVAKGNPIPTIDAEVIKTFLKQDVILPYDSDELQKIPFVMGNNDGRKLIAETQNLYVKGNLIKGTQYGVYHKGDLIKDDSSNKLGYRAEFVGVLVAGDQVKEDMAKTFAVKNVSAIKQGDFVLPFNEDTGYDLYFVPKAAKVDTSVVAIAEDGKIAGKYSTVILGKGSKDGVAKGDVFSLLQPGQEIAGRDADDIEYSTMATVGKELVALRKNTLPDEMIGQVMVYRTYDNVSLGLIMKCKDSVTVGYKAVKP